MRTRKAEGARILVRILSVDQPSRVAHVLDKHGGKIAATFREGGPIQQVPATGEVWSATMASHQWVLQNRMDDADEQERVEGLTEGDVHIKSKGGLHVNDGQIGYTTWERIAVNGSSDNKVTLATAPAHLKTIQVFKGDGTLLLPTNFSLADKVLSFGSTPAAQTLTIYYQRT